ncbi:DUF308 domain-containing protein [Candidatus Saccharibacteria bacterium]|nr:DUF308 domain-containing protein [Candidatus Saccharibacteria bacterium]
MAKINRKYIDKHWLVFVVRSLLAGTFGVLLLFSGTDQINNVMIEISVFLLLIGVIDSVSALYNSSRKRGWINSVIDAGIDVVAAAALLFFVNSDLATSVMILSIYTVVSGAIDIFHGFVSTVDPTDRFIRVLAGICGCVIGIAILNAGGYEITTFVRFFGAYMLIVGITSAIYGVHNRAQNIEDKVARRQARKRKK